MLYHSACSFAAFAGPEVRLWYWLRATSTAWVPLQRLKMLRLILRPNTTLHLATQPALSEGRRGDVMVDTLFMQYRQSLEVQQ